MSDDQKTALEVAQDAAQVKADETNATRSGKGTRVKVGLTRGRNPQVISFEQFDDALPETLPATLGEFMELTKTNDEKVIVGYLLDGFNSTIRTQTSDPVSEFVDASWPEEVQKSFKLVVKQYAANAGVSIDDAVALIKPGIVASQAKKTEPVA